jgi:hypothetical protein
MMDGGLREVDGLTSLSTHSRRRGSPVQIDMLVAEGPRVTALLTFSSGDLPNNARSAVWTATSIMEFAGGQVVKTWVNSDALSALTQLGAPLRASHSQGGERGWSCRMRWWVPCRASALAPLC